MHLVKLKLAGFKTFVDPTTVLVAGRLIGVVGPNGCGKSNIIDAVRWVLGESRASALRGESMQDVIFNGSTQRSAVSRASVELIFDNNQGKLTGPWGQYAEISVKRILDRSGDSSYWINQQRVRRKDVVDLFLGTGLGPRAYAIIEQGMISRVIEARPEEVRAFIEEAAGVTRYRERRRETEGRLEDARDNLKRLEDIRQELGHRIEHLSTQAQAAEHYRALKADHAQQQQLLWLLKKQQAQAQQAQLNARLQHQSAQLDADNTRLAQAEEAIERYRAQHFSAAEHTHEAQSALASATAEVVRLESEIRLRTEAQQRLSARLTEITTLQQDWQQRRNAQHEAEQRWHALRLNAQSRQEKASRQAEETSQALTHHEQQQQAANRVLQDLQREYRQNEQQIRLAESNRSHIERTLERIRQQIERLEASPVSDPLDHEALQQAEIDAAEAEEKKQQCLCLLETLQSQTQQAQQHYREAEQNERLLQRQLNETRVRCQALQQLQAKVQQQGRQADWLKQNHLDQATPLWSMLSVAGGWENALTAVLRERLSAWLVSPSFDIAALASASPADMVSVVLPGVATPSTLPETANVPAGCTPLLNHVRAEKTEVQTLLNQWLHNVYAVDRLAPYLQNADLCAAGMLLVSREGQLLGHGVWTYFSSSDPTAGIMERQREIDQLLETEAQQAQAYDTALATLHHTEQTLQQQQQQLSRQRHEQQQLQQAAHQQQMLCLQLQQRQQRAEEQAQRVAQELQELRGQAEEERFRLEEIHENTLLISEVLEQRQEALEEAKADFDRCDQRLTQARQQERNAQQELQEARFSERECSGKLEDAQQHLQTANEQVIRLQQDETNCRAELSQTQQVDQDDALQCALMLRHQQEERLQICRENQAEYALQLQTAEEERLRLQHAAHPVREEINELRLAVQAQTLAVEQHQARLDEAQADETALSTLLTERTQEHILQREVSRLAREIGALGEVNLAALEELRTETQRKSYLDAQHDDLVRAIETLESAIRRIDRETREQLQETYDSVNNHFAHLFPRLFGGGQARLVLLGEEILDAGVQIIAQPPGKKNSSIHLLSGGEKTLTAIALVFAMFQLNPAPFCMLDEVDAPLDDANTERYGQLVKYMSAYTQFIFISHNKITMEIAEKLVGITMREQGVSRVVNVDIEQALQMTAEAATA